MSVGFESAVVSAAVTSPNIASPAFKADPYGFYARLRAESPVFRVELPTREPAWLISKRTRFFSMDGSGAGINGVTGVADHSGMTTLRPC